MALVQEPGVYIGCGFIINLISRTGENGLRWCTKRVRCASTVTRFYVYTTIKV